MERGDVSVVKKRIALTLATVLLVALVTFAAVGCLSKSSSSGTSSKPTNSSRITTLESQVAELTSQLNLLNAKISVMEKELK